jgi:pilus assembly protein CpaF
MKLSERLGQVPETPSVERSHPERPAAVQATRTRDPLAEFKSQARAALFSKLEARTIDASLGEEQLRSAVAAELERLMAAGDAPLTAAEREKIAVEITQDIVGHGPIEKYLSDPTVTEVMVNATDPVFIERDGRIIQTEVRFSSEEHLRHVIERIVARVGRRIDESSPMVDARLADGSRVNAVIPPLAIDGPALTIRKFSRDPYGVEELVNFGTLTLPLAGLLKACVQSSRQRRDGHRQDHAAQRALVVHPLRRADRDDRGRRGAPAPPDQRGPAGEPPAQHRGQGPRHDPRPAAQLPAHAARPHRRG